MKEMFKDIPWYEWIYQVSNLGNIKNSLKNRLLKKSIDKDGYEYVNLHKDKKQKLHRVHRLVLYAFEWLLDFDVNHIDWNKLNNRVENLEYCTKSYNTRHYYDCIKI